MPCFTRGLSPLRDVMGVSLRSWRWRRRSPILKIGRSVSAKSSSKRIHSVAKTTSRSSSWGNIVLCKENSIARVAMYLQDKHAIREGMAYAQYAEQRGFEAVWQAESRLVRDAIVPMAAFAAVTSRMKIGSGVINNW